VLAEAEGERQVTLLATGSEVSIAVAAREMLAREGIRTAVVSMPCWELFEKSPKDQREAVLGAAPRLPSRPPSSSGGSAGSARAARLSG
jgi:transketolase